MSNINLVLSNAISAARGDKSAVAAAVSDGIFKSFSQLSLHGQKTPFQNGIAALKGWKGELASSLESVILGQYKAALDLHASKAKPTADELAAVEAAILSAVNDSYSQEAVRVENKKAEAKVKRTENKKAQEKAAEAAKLEEASDILRLEAEVLTVRSMLDTTLAERDALRDQVASLTAERDNLLIQMAGKANRKVKAVA